MKELILKELKEVGKFYYCAIVHTVAIISSIVAFAALKSLLQM